MLTVALADDDFLASGHIISGLIDCERFYGNGLLVSYGVACRLVINVRFTLTVGLAVKSVSSTVTLNI